MQDKTTGVALTTDMVSDRNCETTLYSYWRSSCSWRVRIALHYKRIPFQTRPINLLHNEQSAPDYASTLNPGRVVPTLCMDGVVLTQSVAIMEYLEERNSGGADDACASARGSIGANVIGNASDTQHSLLPVDAKSRAQVRAIVQLIVADTQPVQNLRVLQYVGRIVAEGAAASATATGSSTTATGSSTTASGSGSTSTGAVDASGTTSLSTINAGGNGNASLSANGSAASVTGNASTSPANNNNNNNTALTLATTAKQEWARHWIERGLDAVEQYIRQTAGVFCVGDRVTFADLCLVPQVYNARRYY